MLCGARDVVLDNLGVCRDKLSGWSVKKTRVTGTLECLNYSGIALVADQCT